MTIFKLVDTSSARIAILATGVLLCLMCTPALAETTDLIAAQNFLAGSVDVSSDGTDLEVTFDTNDDWELLAVHLAVGCDLADIPQNGGGNPKIGQFPYSMSFDPPVDSHSFTIPYADLPDNCDMTGDNVVIAAHAVVLDVVNFTTTEVLSGINLSDTQITRRRAGGSLPSIMGSVPETCDDPTGKSWSGGDYDLLVSRDATFAWEPNPGFPDPNPPNSPSVWDGLGAPGTCLGAGTCACVNGECSPAQFCTATDCADWIWDGFRTDENNVGMFFEPICGTVLRMEHSFDIPGYLPAGTLYLTCDNGYEASLNGSSLGSAQVAGDMSFPDWKLSPLSEGFPTGACNVPYSFTDGWQTVEMYNLSTELSMGGNLLIVDAVNEHMERFEGQALIECKNQLDGNININPGGCIFRLSATSATEDETAWGTGSPFPGNSWAEFFSCTLN